MSFIIEEDLHFMNHVQNILHSFNPITLEEMDRVKLMDRLDTKFIFHIDTLPVILQEASKHYQILEIMNKRLFEYQNLYLDTADNQMYMDHHNGILNRYKIRFRKYMDMGVTYMEIKLKSNKGRTIKTRIKRKKARNLNSATAREFVEKRTPYKYEMLQPKLWVIFSRLTLVHKTISERITLDTGLNYYNDHGECDLSFLSIAEVKQDRTSSQSDFIRLLHSNRIYPYKISKYCLGRILLDRTLKRNRFKSKLLTINKLSHDNRLVHLIG